MLRTLFVKKSVFICRAQHRTIELHFILVFKNPQGNALGGNNLYLRLQAVIVFLFRACIRLSRTGLERLSRRPCLWNHTSNHL